MSCSVTLIASHLKGLHFNLHVQMHKKSYCTIPGFGVGVGIGATALAIVEGASKMLLLYVKVLCDGQGTDRRAFLYAYRSSFLCQFFI